MSEGQEQTPWGRGIMKRQKSWKVMKLGVEADLPSAFEPSLAPALTCGLPLCNRRHHGDAIKINLICV